MREMDYKQTVLMMYYAFNVYVRSTVVWSELTNIN